MTEIKKETPLGILAQAQHYGRMLFKWKWTAMIFFSIVVAGGALYAFLSKPIFMAASSIWIEDEPKILPFDVLQTPGAGSDLPSNTRLLKSRVLAVETLEKLKLYENSRFTGTPADGKGSFAEENAAFREELIGSFLKSISVTQDSGTRLVDVRFNSPDPKISADAVNALVEGFISMISKKRYSDSEQAMEFLKTQIASLRTEISDREKKLNEYGSQRNILPPTTAEAPTVSRLTEFNKALTNATIEQINRFNYYNQIKNAPLGEIPDAPSGSLIQSLRSQYSTLSREYTKRLATIRPEYPEMRRLKSELDAATEALQNETENIVRIAFTDYQAALQKEESFQKQLDNLKNDAFRSNSNSIQYNALRIELDSKKTLLEALSKKQSETDVSSQLKGLKAINVWVVDRADPPLRPFFPKKRKILLIALLIAVAGGAGLAIILETLTQTVKTSKDVAKATELVTLGVIPSFGAESKWSRPKTEWERFFAIVRGGTTKIEKNRPYRKRSADVLRDSQGALRDSQGVLRDGQDALSDNKDAASAKSGSKIELIAAQEPRSIQAEGFRSIRTTLLISSPPRKTSVILFTSALAREGKSSTVSNLALVMSKGGKRVVIVDSDLRKPKQHKLFETEEGPGLTQYLSTFIDGWQAVKPTQFPNLSLVKCGPIPANPIDLLTSERMGDLITALKENFDYIFIDTPPILAVSDALAVGAMVDGAILVVRGGQTPITALKQAKDKLDSHKIKCLGVIMNDVDLIEEDCYYAREYYHYADRNGNNGNSSLNQKEWKSGEGLTTEIPPSTRPM